MLPYLAHAVAFQHYQYIPADPVQRRILLTPFNNCSLTFTSHTSTVSCKLSMYFLMCVILALTAALFLTNALRVWESMVLRIGKERAN